MSWRVARSLDTLLAEINAAAPNRSKLSDGSIGDPAHSSRESDHNPNPAGVVRARDFTHDPGDGCDAGALAEAVRRLGLSGHPALGPGAYVIWNYRIASATDDGQAWDWEPYAGSNGHTKHCHVSVATAAAGYDSTKPWGVMGALEPEGFIVDKEADKRFDQLNKQAVDLKADVAALTKLVDERVRATSFKRDDNLKGLIRQVLDEVRSGQVKKP